MPSSDNRWNDVYPGRVYTAAQLADVLPLLRCSKHSPLEAEWCPACAATAPAPVVPEARIITVTVFSGGFDENGAPWSPDSVFDFIVSALDDADVSAEVNLSGRGPGPVSLGWARPGSDPFAEPVLDPGDGR